MTQEKQDKKPAAESFAEMFRAFGQAVSEVFNDPALKEQAKTFADSTSKSAKTLADRFKDDEVKAKFRDVGKAAQDFGKSVNESFRDSGLKEQARGAAESAAASAKTLAGRFKDEEVKAKFRDAGKAARDFGKSVSGSIKGEKTGKRNFTIEEAKQIGENLGIDWSRFAVDQFRMGLDVELEHGMADPHTNISWDDPLLTGKIALAHLNELPDYYSRLAKMEEEARRDTN